MATSHREVETKYEVTDGSRLPGLAGLPGVAALGRPEEQRLEAVYFDTRDLALAAARTTLRRRTGGGDAGWHLKRPLPGGDRHELRLPLGRARRRVPAALVDEVRVVVRDRDVAPVAELATDRVVHRLFDRDGELLVEVVDDSVTARTLGDGAGTTAWREWEVELGPAGDRDLMAAVGERLLAAGATPARGPSKLSRALADRLPPAPAEAEPPSAGDPASAVVLAHLREQVTELQLRDPLVRRDEPDSVHKMRVATRRLRSALATFRPLLDREETDPLRDELKWLASVLGEARDAEVMRERLVAEVEAQPADLVVGPVRRRVDADQADAYRAAHDRVLETLDTPRYFRLLDRLDDLVARPPWTPEADRPAGDVLPLRVRRAWKRLRREVDAADSAPTPDERDHRLHEARKAAKRARYAAEALTPAFGDRAKEFAGAVEAVQEVLGDHQDSVVTRALLLELAREATDAGESAFTYGRLHALEEAGAADSEARFRAAWDAASAKRLRRWLKH